MDGRKSTARHGPDKLTAVCYHATLAEKGGETMSKRMIGVGKATIHVPSDGTEKRVVTLELVKSVPNLVKDR